MDPKLSFEWARHKDTGQLLIRINGGCWTVEYVDSEGVGLVYAGDERMWEQLADKSLCCIDSPLENLVVNGDGRLVAFTPVITLSDLAPYVQHCLSKFVPGEDVKVVPPPLPRRR